MAPELFNHFLRNLQKDVRPDFTKFTSEFEFNNDIYSFVFHFSDEDSEIVFYKYVNVSQKLNQYITASQTLALGNLILLMR